MAQWIRSFTPCLRAFHSCVCVSARSFERLGTRCLSLSEPEDRNEDEWAALQAFADALNKKFNKAIIGQE